MFGVLNINKPKGMTSHDVISRLRKILKEKQIGHAGTLDPFAIGVLPVFIGKATRLIEYVNGEKAYIATVQFGANTDTYDIDGKTIEIFNEKISENEILTALKNFEGEITQVPPIYSAIKINGKKLYEYAREGKTVEIKPRKVVIEKIKLLNFNYEKQQAKIYIKCSKGTYIRSIAFDLGKILKCGAYLAELERVQAGSFKIENAVNLNDIDEQNVSKFLINPLEIIDLPQIEINDDGLIKVKYGQILHSEDLITKISESNYDLIILVYNKDAKILCATARINCGNIKLEKVFI